jgi:hypothetical protein
VGSQLDAGGEAQVRTGIRNSGTQNAGGTRAEFVPAGPADPTLEILMKVGGALLQPHLDRAKTEAYFNGMQRAAAGEAVTDIAENQPWYSTLFGEADVVEGARAYAGNTVAQGHIGTMEENMDKLREMGSDEAQKYFNGVVQGSMTGDAKTDTSIMQAYMRSLPPVMRRQAKEHYGWQQQTAVTQMGASMRAEGDRLQGAAAGYAAGTITGEEWTERNAAFQQASIPPAGINEKNTKEGIKDYAMLAADRGQMHVVNTLLDGSGEVDLDGNRIPGLASVLSEDQQRAVRAAAVVGERKAMLQYNDTYAMELAGIEYRAAHPEVGDVPEAELKGMIDNYNDRYAKSVGGKMPPITGAMQAALLSRQGGAILAARVEEFKLREKNAEVLRKEGKEAAADGILDAAILGHYGKEYAGDIVHSNVKGVTAARINAVLSKAYTEEYKQNPTKAMQSVVNMYNGRQYVPVSIKEQLIGSVTGALATADLKNFTPEVQKPFDEFYAMWQTSKGAAVAAYDGDGLAAKLSGYAQALDRGQDKLTAFTTNMTMPHAAKHDLSEKEIKGAVSALTSLNNGWIKGWAGDNTLEPGQAEKIAGELAVDIKAYRGYQHDAETSTQLVMNTHLGRQRNKLQILGGYSFRTNSDQMTDVVQYLTGTLKGEDGKPLLHRTEEVQNISTDKVSKEFNAAVKAIAYGDRITGQGSPSEEAKDITVIRGPDEENTRMPQWMVTYIDADGNAGRGWLRGSAIPERAAAYRKYRKEFDNSQGTTLPSTVGNRFQDRVMPNIVGKPTR